MQHTDVDDKAWTKITVGGLEGAYRVDEGQVHVVYGGRHKTVGAEHFVQPIANAAAEGLARIALAELIGHSDADE